MCLSTSTAFVCPVKLLFLTSRLVFASTSSGSLQRASAPLLAQSHFHSLLLLPKPVLPLSQAPKRPLNHPSARFSSSSGGVDFRPPLLLPRVQALEVDPPDRALELAERDEFLKSLAVAEG